MSTTAAAPSLDEVTALLEDSAYNPSIVPQLEAYVRATSSSKAPYCLDANRTLVKLYQFFPHLEDEGTTALVLLLALVHFPSTDILSLSCLVPERVQSREPCATIMRCANLLDSCRFAEFWSEYDTLGDNNNNALLQSLATSSKSALVESILGVLALSHRTISVEKVLAATNLQKLQPSQVIESMDNKTVTFVATSDNTKRNRVFQEGVSFTQIATMINNQPNSNTAVVRE